MEPEHSYTTNRAPLVCNAKIHSPVTSKSKSLWWLLLALPLIQVVKFIVLDYLNKSENDATVKYWIPGDKAFNCGDYTVALTDYQQFERRFPTNALIHHAVARTYVKMHRIPQAHEELAQGIDDLSGRDEGYRKPWTTEYNALSRTSSNETPYAIAFAKFWIVGDKALQRSDYTMAIANYQQFERRYPNNAWIHHAVARVLIKMHHVSDARTELNLAIHNFPDGENPQVLSLWTAERDASGNRSSVTK